MCVVFNLFGFIRIKCRRQAISPLMVHDREPPDETGTIKWASQIRYNKALFTNAATPIFCVFLLVGIYITTDYAMSWQHESIGTSLRPKCTFLRTKRAMKDWKLPSHKFQNRKNWKSIAFFACKSSNTWYSLQWFSTYFHQHPENTSWKS